jgi:hypothetical protein
MVEIRKRVRDENKNRVDGPTYIAMPDWVMGGRRKAAGVSIETEKWKVDPGDELRLPVLPAEVVRNER